MALSRAMARSLAPPRGDAQHHRACVRSRRTAVVARSRAWRRSVDSREHMRSAFDEDADDDDDAGDVGRASRDGGGADAYGRGGTTSRRRPSVSSAYGVARSGVGVNERERSDGSRNASSSVPPATPIAPSPQPQQRYYDGSSAGGGRGARTAGMNRRQKYVMARGAGAASTTTHREKRTVEGEMDLRATKSSHGAVARHINAQKPSARGGGRSAGQQQYNAQQQHNPQQKPPLRAGERIVLAMESIETPAAGERIAWDVVGAAVNPQGVQFKFSTSTLNFAIKELGERGSFDRAYALYLWMSRKRGRFAPNEFTYVALAGAAQTSNHVRMVQSLWRKLIEDTIDGEENASTTLVCNEIASAVIAALNRASDWSGAYQVFKDMREKGKARNLYTYTAVLTALRDEAKADEAMAVLNDMRAEPGVQPTSLAFALTLSAFDNSRRWIEGNALAMRIKQYDVRPDTTLMHAIITMAGRAGDMAHASDVFNAMRQSTMIVTTYTFNALLGGYARYGDWDGCVEVYDEMKRSRLQPDSYTFTQLISAAERSGEYVAADGVWAEMLRARIIPHTVMCGAYIHCLGCQSRDLEAAAVMEKMRNFWDVPRNAAVYNALIGAHVRSGEVTRALSVLEEMQRIDGLMPTEITFAVLIRACQESALTKRAADLESMRDSLANAGQLVQDLSGAGSSM